MSWLLAAARRRKLIEKDATFVPGPNGIQDESEKPLGLPDLVAIGIGGTLGSGLFLLAGSAAREVAGPAVTLSFVLAAVSSLFSGMSYAEMSSRDPDCGGAYAFAYAALGELPAFLVGSCLTLEYGVASAAIARSWASYLGEAINVLPGWTVGRDTQISFFAFLLVVGITLILSQGMREAKWLINISTALYGCVVAIIIVLGARSVDAKNWTPFAPFGVTGILAGASHVFFSFIGFDEVATVAEEARNASQAVPLAMMLSLAIVAVVYFAATLVLTGMVNYTQLDPDAPFSAAFRSVDMNIVAQLVGLGTATGMMNTTLVSLAAQPRIFFSMGRDGLLPRWIASTMRSTTLKCGTVVAAFALLLPTELLADVVSGGTLLAFLATNTALLCIRIRIHSQDGTLWTYVLALSCLSSGVMYRMFIAHYLPFYFVMLFSLPSVMMPCVMLGRKNMIAGSAVEPQAPLFLCPFVPAVPILGTLTTTFLLTQLPAISLGALFVWILVSFVLYAMYGAVNSTAEFQSLVANGDNASDSRSMSSTTPRSVEENSDLG